MRHQSTSSTTETETVLLTVPVKNLVMEYPDDRIIDSDQYRATQRRTGGRSQTQQRRDTQSNGSSQHSHYSSGRYPSQFTQEQPLNMPATGGPVPLAVDVDFHPQHAGYSMNQRQYAAHPAAAAAYGTARQHTQQTPQQPVMYAGQYGQPSPGYPHHHFQPQQQQPSHYPPQQQQRHNNIAMEAQHSVPDPQYPPPVNERNIPRQMNERPLVKLTLNLIDSYRRINEVYYEEKRRTRRKTNQKSEEQQQSQKKQEIQIQKAKQEIKQQQDLKEIAGEERGHGVNNNGWDDEHYDYIFTKGEKFCDRYILQERIGKGSFGQVVRALDTKTQEDVAIKIIKSKKPFQLQARTEIELLTHLNQRDREDQNNIVRLLKHFMFRNHQCLVFEMLSLNLYELLKNTQFGGVSLNLIRKFAKQILKALQFLARPDVDVIHCDLKPENILLRHPKRSGVKVIDFGSSCRSNRRMYSYIQSRFYRSPEVMLGLPYSVAIDIWSLGCILVEMHTGEPLFSGSDQVDQMQKIVKILGMVPDSMLERSNDQKLQFFEKDQISRRWVLKRRGDREAENITPSLDPIATLGNVIGADPSKRKKHPNLESGQSPGNYDMFVDLIYKMLAFRPEERIAPEEALLHPFIVAGEDSALQHSTTGTEASTPSSRSGYSRPRPDP